MSDFERKDIEEFIKYIQEGLVKTNEKQQIICSLETKAKFLEQGFSEDDFIFITE